MGCPKSPASCASISGAPALAGVPREAVGRELAGWGPGPQAAGEVGARSVRDSRLVLMLQLECLGSAMGEDCE